MSIRTILEIVVTAIILITISYRLAVLYDWVPPDFQPWAVAKNEYKQFKFYLSDESRKPDWFGKTAYFFQSTFHNIESYWANYQKKEQEEDATIARCKENGIFRFFMTMGQTDSNQCVETNQRVKAVENDINNKKPNANTNTNNRTNRVNTNNGSNTNNATSNPSYKN